MNGLVELTLLLAIVIGPFFAGAAVADFVIWLSERFEDSRKWDIAPVYKWDGERRRNRR